jgi:hypothetical protein
VAAHGGGARLAERARSSHGVAAHRLTAVAALGSHLSGTASMRLPAVGEEVVLREGHELVVALVVMESDGHVHL